VIVRDVEAASRREFDLVIVGGGIHGVALLHEAARRGVPACLCEARDFGGATSWNSLRILHGGLRYLQTLNLVRFFDSVAARRRLALMFPRLVRPLTCLMPLYGNSLRRTSVLRMALFANDVLSPHRNSGLPESMHLPRGTIEGPSRVRREFPPVRGEGLTGGACWTDYLMISSERILIELLRDACRHGAVALNYAPVDDVVQEGGVARAVRVRDSLSGATHVIAARAIVNCAGADLPKVAKSLGGDAQGLFRPSLAFNVLLDLAPLSDCALAVAGPQAAAQIMFLVPMRDSLLAGTMHVPRPEGALDAAPTQAEVAQFVGMLNAAVPRLGARVDRVRRVFSGLLPATAVGSTDLEGRDRIFDHGRSGGLQRAYSVSGVKFTTATSVAKRALRMTCEPYVDPPGPVADIELSSSTPLLIDSRRLCFDDEGSLHSALKKVVDEESVHSMDDLVLRRTNWATTDADLGQLRERLAALIDLPSMTTGLWDANA